jgi:hypothetical protein
VRNLLNRGVPERVAMTVTGHKTRGVFDRYHIVSPGDLQEAARKLAGTLPDKRRVPISQPTVFLGGGDWAKYHDRRPDGPPVVVSASGGEGGT